MHQSGVQEQQPSSGMCRHQREASLHGVSLSGEKCVYCTVTDLRANDWLDESIQALQGSVRNCYLEDIKNGGRIPLVGYIFRIGRLDSNHIVVKDESLSRTHAVITYEDGRFFIQDLGSTNGTLRNGSSLRQRECLADGDIIRLGSTQFQFNSSPAIKQFPVPNYEQRTNPSCFD